MLLPNNHLSKISFSYSTCGCIATLKPPGYPNEEFTDTWKVLVYDQACRDIISPLMNIGALRQKGVTLHMLVSTMLLVLFENTMEC